MKDHTDITSFHAAVDAIPLMGFQTRIDRALRLAQKELFAEINGGREKIPKILILLTDGTQTKSKSAESPGVVADEIRSVNFFFRISIIILKNYSKKYTKYCRISGIL